MSLTFFIITIFLMITNLIWMIFFTPMVPNQEWAQKIFYLHVPIAWSGFLAYFFVMVSGICFLYTKNLKFDRIGLASAEIGTIFTALVLIKVPLTQASKTILRTTLIYKKKKKRGKMIINTMAPEKKKKKKKY